MKRTTLLARLLLALCCAAPAVAAGAATDTADPSDAERYRGERAYLHLIEEIESHQGAYAGDLSEPLLSLGLSLQAQNRHPEAIAVFKRGVHLTRVNDGLYSTRQIPLLQGEISSLISTGDYAEADERQRYLYRVQVRSLDSGEPMTSALMQQADWQFEAYQLGLGPQGYTRLMNMWDLYRLALNDVIDREGETSRKLLPPLRGMLRAQYLISSYEFGESDRGSGDDVRARQNLHRFSAYRAQSYQKGSAVISAIHGVEQNQEKDNSLATVETLVMLGDWRLWHEDREAAWEAYREAQAELAGRNDAKEVTERLLGAPAALPNITGLSPLPPEVPPENGDILLEFGITERGRVVDLERLDDNADLDSRANRIMRKLRKTRFRPRIESGQPVGTDKLVKAFKIL
jgi:hypothetical protein